MHNSERLNPIDEICRTLSLAYLLADKDDPDALNKYADTELDGLYEFAKIIYSISREKQFMPKASQQLLEAVGMRVKYPPVPNLDRDGGPHIFVANRSGNDLIDGAIGTVLMSRLGLSPTIVSTKNQHLFASPDEVISVEHPRIQRSDPRSNSEIARHNSKSVLEMRAALAKGRGLLIFPGAGTFRSEQQGRLVLDGSFDRLAPVLLACKDLNPKLHLYHFDYVMPSWWTKLLDRDRASFFTTQWKAVLGLNRQVAEVRHLKTMSIDCEIGRPQRFELSQRLFGLTSKITTQLGCKRLLEAA